MLTVFIVGSGGESWNEIDTLALVTTDPAHTGPVFWAKKPSAKRFGRRHVWLIVASLILAAIGYMVETFRASEVAAERAILAPARLLEGTTVKLLPSSRRLVEALPIVWASSVSRVSSQRHERLPAQAVGGVPDVWPDRIDARAAWAPQWQDAGYETLEVGFSPATIASGVVVFESLNPGAIHRLSIEVGDETLALWERHGPTPVAGDNQVMAFQLAEPRIIRRLTVTLDTRLVEGFNAIDAVGLIPRD